MLRQIELELKLPKGKRINSNMGSIFHGLLMELFEGDVADILHIDTSVRPFSQGVYFNKEKQIPVWRISTMVGGLGDFLIESLSALKGYQVHLHQKDYYAGIVDVCTETKISYKELADEIFLAEEVPKTWDISFVTTTSFKRDDRYVILPEMYLIFNSLLMRWNALNPEMPIHSIGLEKELAFVCMIVKYNLQSSIYSVDGKNIYGFSGKMTLRLMGNDMENRIMALLLRFAQYAGIGMKTALGMGVINVTYRR